MAGMFALKKISYKQKPAIYITNNYYTWKGGDTYEKFREFDSEQGYDIVFAGSSRAYRGYSPSIFESNGYKSFNLGTSAQTIKNTYFTIKNYLTGSNCKLLILDVFSGAFTSSFLESTSDLVENVSRPQAAYDIAWNHKDIRTLNISVLRYLTENDAPYFKIESNADRGFSTRSDSLPKEKQEFYFSKKPIDHPKLKIRQEQLDHFENILSYCEQNSIKVVCVYAPVSYFYDSTQHSDFLALIKPSLQKHKTPIYDLSGLEGINTAYHFYDDSHLNQIGVRMFNTELIEQLQNDHLLTKNAVN